MPRIFLLAALRNLLRHKVQTLINISSLALGLTVFGFAFLYVKQELSYDRGWPEGERVHRLLVEQRGLPGLPDGVFATVAAESWQRITDYFASDIEAATRLTSLAGHLVEPESQRTGLMFVDPQFREVFELEVVAGDINRTFSGPGFIAVEQGYAERSGIMGRVGERFTFATVAGVQIEYELAAIYRLPQPVSPAAAFQMLTLIHDYSLPLFGSNTNQSYIPWQRSTPVWVKLKPGVATESFNALQPAFVEQTVTNYNDALGPGRKVSDHLLYRWQPLTEIHFNPVQFEGGSGAGDPARVATFAIVGLLVLLVGCSNSVSLSLAAALERRREVGVRKAAGALQHDILSQQLGESLLLALLALIPAIAILELLLPAFQTLLPFSVRVEAKWGEYALLGLIAALTGLACGAYPAFVLSSTRPQAVLRTGAQTGLRVSFTLRSLLVAVQFCLASMLLIGTAALYLQLAITRAQPLGFDASNLVLTLANQGVSQDVLLTEFEKIPGVERVIRGFNIPNAGMPPGVNSLTVVRGAGDASEVKAEAIPQDFDFIELMGIRVLAGRGYDVRLDTDEATREERRFVLNESAVRELGFASPAEAVDQTIFMRTLNSQSGKVGEAPVRIIGVVEDNLYASLRRRPGPEIHILMGPSGGRPGNLLLKYDDTAEASIQARLQEVALRVNGSPLSGMMFAEPQIAAAFRQEQNESRLLLICGGLALLLASFGLYGLAAFAIERQIKEVGVRKVMGAEVKSIVALYLWRFTRPILLANLVAWPVAIYFVLRWIERFPYQMERAWLAPLCIATLGAVLLIAMLTVSVITTRAATANPVRSLRYE